MADRKTVLNVEDLISYVRGAVAVLRALEICDTTITYAGFAQAIGLMQGPDAKWEPWHRRQVGEVLYATAALQKKADKRAKLLDVKRIVAASTGRPGQGASKTVRIVVK